MACAFFVEVDALAELHLLEARHAQQLLRKRLLELQRLERQKAYLHSMKMAGGPLSMTPRGGSSDLLVHICMKSFS